ncbi:MAG: nuclear transport factor 2 family protein [Gammaproteobacteria bacterium]|nr:nuclear transport factor 2 family protein [Gammaproteobacteria bacterium]
MSSASTGSGSGRDLVGRFWNEVQNPPYSMAVFDELVADDFAISTDGHAIEGMEAFRAWLQAFQPKIGDLKTQPDAILVAEDGRHVTTRMRVSGLNKGLFGTQPDQVPVILVAISVMEVRRGQLAYDWVERSAFELHQRLTAKTS